MQPDARANLLGDLGQVLMMRQIDYLPVPGHLGEQPEGLLGAEVIECLHDVVGDERNGCTIGDELVISRHPKREIQLEPCALGEFVGDLRTAVRRDGDQDFSILAGLGGDTRVGSAADGRERLRRSCHHAAPMAISIELQCLLCGGYPRAKLDVTTCPLLDLQQNGAPLLLDFRDDGIAADCIERFLHGGTLMEDVVTLSVLILQDWRQQCKLAFQLLSIHRREPLLNITDIVCTSDLDEFLLDVRNRSPQPLQLPGKVSTSSNVVQSKNAAIFPIWRSITSLVTRYSRSSSRFLSRSRPSFSRCSLPRSATLIRSVIVRVSSVREADFGISRLSHNSNTEASNRALSYGISIANPHAQYNDPTAPPYPTASGAVGAPFSDVNLKLAVMSSLLDAKLLDLGTPEQLATHVLRRPVDLEKDGYDLIPEALDYLARYPLTDDLLASVERMEFDGGATIYPFAWYFWSGEEGAFDIKDLSGIRFCPNLKSLSVISMMDKVDSKVLVPLKRLERVSINVPSESLEALLDLPSLKEAGRFSRNAAAAPILEKLEQRGVQVD